MGAVPNHDGTFGLARPTAFWVHESTVSIAFNRGNVAIPDVVSENLIARSVGTVNYDAGTESLVVLLFARLQKIGDAGLGQHIFRFPIGAYQEIGVFQADPPDDIV